MDRGYPFTFFRLEPDQVPSFEEVMIKRLGELGHGEGQRGDEAAHGLLMLTRRRRLRQRSESCSVFLVFLLGF